jgi:hypothetical protein
MAHDQAALRRRGEELWKQGGKIRILRVAIGAGESRIGGDAELVGAAAHAAAQEIDHQPFRVRPGAAPRSRLLALTHPGVRRDLPGGCQHRGRDARQQMDVAMAVDEIRRAPERRREGGKLRAHLRSHALPIEAAQERLPHHPFESKKGAVGERREILGERAKRRGQREMQPDRNAPAAGIEDRQRDRLRAREARRRHHHRRGVEAGAQHEIADRRIHPRRDAVIVRAQPDAARRRIGLRVRIGMVPRDRHLPSPSFAHSAALRAGSPASRVSAALRSCSATK